MWLSAADIAEAALPGLPRDKRKVNERAEAECWALKVDAKGQPLARKRAARGGGVEYHVSVLPVAARTKLLMARADAPAVEAKIRSGTLWSWFDGQSDKTKAKAQERLARIDDVAALEREGMTATAAIAAVAAQFSLSKSSINNWRAAVRHVPLSDRLPHLASQHEGGGKECDVDPECWLVFKSNFLRKEKPTFAQCYRFAETLAAARGVTLPHVRTFMRKLEREVDPLFILQSRAGNKVLQSAVPAQERDVSMFHALEWVNIDGHLADIFVEWEDGKVSRPMIVASQDIYSSKLLTWSVGHSEDIAATRHMFAQMFAKYGIPKGCLMDNSRTFASKALTGGVETRFRGKVLPTDPTGMLTALGVEIKFATPFHGQAKPIERAFRDLASAFKHPALAGAYTGNNTQNKPDNYGEKSIPIAQFELILGQLIAEHNSRIGRRGRGKLGRSFDDMFNESYAASAIGKASPEQLAIAMLTAKNAVPTDKYSGEIKIFGNRYHTPELTQIAGDKVIVRFDPAALHSEIRVYDLSGKFLVTAPIIEAVGFHSEAAAKDRGKKLSDMRGHVRKAADIERLLSVEELARMMPDIPEDDDLPDVSIIRPVRHRGQTAAALRPVLDGDERALNAPRAAPHSVIDRIAKAQLRLVE